MFRSVPAFLSVLITALLLAVLIVPTALGRLAERPSETAQRLRADGLSQAAIAAALGISRYRVKRLLSA